VSDVDLVTSMSGANAFVEFAKRGFFAYDWSDVHRATHQALMGYELQYRPLNPVIGDHVSKPSLGGF
jgi:hypothetical protein